MSNKEKIRFYIISGMYRDSRQEPFQTHYMTFADSDKPHVGKNTTIKPTDALFRVDSLCFQPMADMWQGMTQEEFEGYRDSVPPIGFHRFGFLCGEPSAHNAEGHALYCMCVPMIPGVPRKSDEYPYMCRLVTIAEWEEWVKYKILPVDFGKLSPWEWGK